MNTQEEAKQDGASDAPNYVLKDPILLDGKECKNIYFRKPKARDRYTAIERAGAGAAGQMVILESILLCVTGEVAEPSVRRLSIPRETYYNLSWRDAAALEEVFVGFLGSET